MTERGTSNGWIPISGPSITDKEVAYVADAARSAWYESANVFHERFEKAFAAYVGTEWAVALPSCTSAIHLALLSHGVSPGDEVVVPDVTWIASAAPVTYCGATPVFADMDPVDWCVTPESVERCLTPKTKAVLVVDLYGSMPTRWDELRALCAQRGLALIEDAAEALGSEHAGRRAGSLGDVGTFSFHGSKTLTTGEGGMLVGRDPDVLKRVLFLRDHGRAPGPKMFWNDAVAFKYKMSSMQAALGLAQLERVDELVAKKRRIFGWYEARLGEVPGLTLNAAPEPTRNSYWMVTILVDPARRLEKEALIARLRGENIDSRPFFYPLSSLPAYAGTPEADVASRRNEVAARWTPFGVNLPSGLSLTEAEVDRVCDAVRRIVTA